MRLWSLHPSYLDVKGLVALWREALLAQKVLIGKTKGYKSHPQLDRFKGHIDPSAAIGFYLKRVWEEARDRGYNFDVNKVAIDTSKVRPIKVSKGQLSFEMSHLRQKLKKRDPQKYKLTDHIIRVKLHPLFEMTQGGIAPWEKGEA